jgi:hypothetical protein
VARQPEGPEERPGAAPNGSGVRERELGMRDDRTRQRGSRSRAGIALAAVLAGIGCRTALAIDFDFSSIGLTGSLRSQVSVGATLRTQAQDTNLIGKLNHKGQEQFCEDKAPAGSPPGTPAPGINCTTPAGNASFLALPGAPSANNDNGDLDYDQWDLTSGALKLAPRLQLNYGEWGLDASVLYFYDAVNAHFIEYHPNNKQDNNGFQPRNTLRGKDAEDQVGSSFNVLNAYVSGTLPLYGDKQLSVKLGNQVASFGTSTLLIFNSLNVVNPPDANIRFLPGSDPRDVFRRVPLAVLGTNFTQNLAMTALYSFQWKPVVVPPIGSFFSTIDAIGAGDPYVMALFGKYREDPNNLVSGGATGQDRTQGNAGQLSDAGRTLYFAAPMKPHNRGEYGLNFNFFAEKLNNTNFALTYLNLHSRFPVIDFIAAQYGCAYNSTNAADATVDCNGFKTAANNHGGGEVAPTDTVKLMLEYPENIHALGLSFSTNLGDVAWTGETVYRPNQPLQVDPVDVGFAALQPLFPAQTITIVPAGGSSVSIPGRRVASPDYVETEYRHHTVVAGQLIPGYERFKTLAYNTSFLMLSGASDNPFGADQMTVLLEVGAYQVLNMPSVDELQIAAPGTSFHHSAGVDGTGTANADQVSDTNTGDRLNPHYQEGGFATPFSWGYRVLSQLTYEQVLPNIRVQPQLVFSHDVDGKSPQPTGEFVAHRKQVLAGFTVNYLANLSGSLRYNWFFGGGLGNLLADRDNLTLTVSYDF